MNKSLENNQVTLSGEIASDFYFNYKSHGEKFYIFYLDIERKSGIRDRLPVCISERLVDVSQNLKGIKVDVVGQYRSFNYGENGKKRLILTVFAKEMQLVDVALDFYNNNNIVLKGTICKETIHRTTPMGRDIADILVAVNRDFGKSDYIPCICWGRVAVYAGGLKIGDKCIIKGRIQSRIYNKQLDDGTFEERVAYEVSVNEMEVLIDE